MRSPNDIPLFPLHAYSNRVLSFSSTTHLSTINTFQAYANNTSHVVYSRSSDENSQSSTPTLQSPPLANAPRPIKIGSVSADIPTGRNRRQSLASEVSAETVVTRRPEATRRRATLSATQHHLSRSPNRSHQRRSSAMSNVSPSLAHPISEDVLRQTTAKRTNANQTIQSPQIRFWSTVIRNS